MALILRLDVRVLEVQPLVRQGSRTRPSGQGHRDQNLPMNISKKIIRRKITQVLTQVERSKDLRQGPLVEEMSLRQETPLLILTTEASGRAACILILYHHQLQRSPRQRPSLRSSMKNSNVTGEVMRQQEERRLSSPVHHLRDLRVRAHPREVSDHPTLAPTLPARFTLRQTEDTIVPAPSPDGELVTHLPLPQAQVGTR